MPERRPLLELHEQLTPADNQTHRRFSFQVPSGCDQLDIHIEYAPKALSIEESARMVENTLRGQSVALASRLGAAVADEWTRAHRARRWGQVRNLVTLSLDDAAGSYRGACHRQAPDQQLSVSASQASPGLVPGPLPTGEWWLTLSAHTLVSPHCDVSIQIGAEMAASLP